MKCVFMAGGKGTRIASVDCTVPKPMIKIGSKPVLEHGILCLRDQGYLDFIITVSHLGEIITEYFGDGSKLGVNIEYYYEKEPLGNAGALFKIKDRLSDTFLLLNADVMFNVDVHRMVEYHKKRKSLATIMTHPNTHPYDSALLVVNKDGFVDKWITKESPKPVYYHNVVNAGIHVLSSDTLCAIPQGKKVDLDRQILMPLAGKNRISAYHSPEYVKDMGTPDRYKQVCEEYKAGVVYQRTLKRKQRAVFLDRDGTINEHRGFISDIEDFHIIDGVAEAIKQINESSYLVIVITNQPVVARGEITEEGLDEIHKKMETILGENGAYIDALYYCPHHPDKGFEGEIPEFKIDCNCRKPKPGMILKAADDFNIDITNSWMIGDSKTDIEAGKNAGCKTALIGTGDFGQDLTGDSLSQLVGRII